MAQRQQQLQLVFSNLNSSSRSGIALSPNYKMRRSRCSVSSSLQQKIALLEKQNPGGAALVERLVDDILTSPIAHHVSKG